MSVNVTVFTDYDVTNNSHSQDYSHPNDLFYEAFIFARFSEKVN